ncbi:retrovirus-related pol polyprotein from transposon TNT 1-94 [Tanacetum coccineum]
MSDFNELYDVKVCVRLLGEIKLLLQTNHTRERIFKRTVFGPWLDVMSHDNDNHLMHYVLQHQAHVSKIPSDAPPIIFHIGDHWLQFGRKEFYKKGWLALSDMDTVRVCLLIVAELVFIGKEDRNCIPRHIVPLVEDFDAWNDYPWGFISKCGPLFNSCREKETMFIASISFINGLVDEDRNVFLDDCMDVSKDNAIDGQHQLETFERKATNDFATEKTKPDMISSQSKDTRNCSVSDVTSNHTDVDQGLGGSANDPMSICSRPDMDNVEVAYDGMSIDKADGKNEYTYSQVNTSTLDILIRAFDYSNDHPETDVLGDANDVDRYAPNLNHHAIHEPVYLCLVYDFLNDYMNVLNNEEMVPDISLDDMKLQHEEDNLTVKERPVEHQPVDELTDGQKDKTTLLQEHVKDQSNKPTSVKERKKRLTMALDSPFGQQGTTTPATPKTRSMSSIGDTIVGPAFEDNLSRPHDCERDKVIVLDDISEYLEMQERPGYRLPLGFRDIVFGRIFWLTLACLDKAKEGWLQDNQLDLWVDLIWYFREPSADWAMVSSHFLPCILGGSMPDYYSNGVYFPVNKPKKHLCLAELQISTGVVTIYDSLGWSKGISVEYYEITYLFLNVLEQSELFGDYGELIQGELVQGELIQGELIQGELVQGELIQGELVQGELIHLIQGELIQGELIQGELLQGELIQGQKKYEELSATEKIQAHYDLKETNITLQGLASDVYSLINHHRVANDLWEKVNTEFLNSLSPEWSKFVTDVKLVRDLHTTNSDQLHAYLERHELYANEVRIMRELNQDPLALDITYPSTPHPNAYSSIVHQDACPQPQSIPQIEYIVFTVNQQTHLVEFPLIDSGLAVPVFKQGDDPIDAINKMMSFLSTVVTSRFPTTNNYLRNSSNPRQQATIHGQQRVVKCFNCQGEGHMARQCPKPKRKRDATWFRNKVLLVEAQGSGKVLNEEELEFLVDPGVAEGLVTKTVITYNAIYQADDLDAYDSDYEDFSTAKAVLMANLSSYGSDVLSEVPHSKNTHNDILNQSVQEMSYSEQTHLVNYPKNEITSDSNIIPNSQYLLETQNAAVQVINFSAQQDDMILYVFEQLSNQETNYNKANKDNLIANEFIYAELKRYKERFADFEKEINYLTQTLSEQSKEKELLTKIFNVLKNESKEKEAKNINKEIALEKKVKELDNINPFYLKKSQQIRPMLYDGSVIAKEINVISIADSEETLMLEEESRSKMLLKQSDPIVLEKKVNIKPINYAELNRLSENFGKHFVPQQELSDEQAFRLQTSHPNTYQSAYPPVKIKAP